MEVKVREKCNSCHGAGTNGMNHIEAIKVVDQWPPCEGSMDSKIRAAQQCIFCDGGYNEKWMGLNELLSSGL